MTAPIEHLEDSLGLTGDHRVDLWKIQLRNSATAYYFWNGTTHTWQGQTYEGLACSLSAESRSSDGERSRPVLTVVNPENMFGPLAADGVFDLATVTRKRVLQDHFQNNVNIFQQNVFISTRVVSISDQLIRLELRYPSDIPVFKTPRRTYNPPEYPFIVI
ncbi:MAG: hypothetical protein ACK4FG_01915 [Brevundimonas sp.]